MFIVSAGEKGGTSEEWKDMRQKYRWGAGRRTGGTNRDGDFEEGKLPSEAEVSLNPLACLL